MPAPKGSSRKSACGCWSRKLVLSVLAVAVSLLGLVFVNIALFNYLVSAWGPVWTPLALGLVNFALAVPVLLIAASAKPGPELAMAEDLAQGRRRCSRG